MKRLLYIGNKLSARGKNPTGIEILGPLLESEGFEVRYASSADGKLKRLAEMLRAVIRYRNQTDFVLIDTYSTSNFWYAFLVSQLCRVFKIPYIPILHGGNLPVRLKKSPLLSRMIFANAYCNVAPSKYLGDRFSDAGYRDVTVIPNPVPTNEIGYKRREVFAPKLLWVRSLASIYNPEMAVRALSELKNKFNDATLCIVGPDSGERERTAEIARSLGLNVSFTGRLRKQQWMEMSTGFDFFINTSTVDNTPFSLIEAAALGLAIVSTNVGGIPYLFTDDHSAKLVAGGDFKSMAAAIEHLIENPGKTREITASARKIALDADWSKVRGQWLEILR